MPDTTIDLMSELRELMLKEEWKQALALCALWGERFPQLNDVYKEHLPEGAKTSMENLKID